MSAPMAKEKSSVNLTRGQANTADMTGE